MRTGVPRSLPPAARIDERNGFSEGFASSALYGVGQRRARLLHIAAASRDTRREKAETLTVDETSFPNAKPRDALLIAYKAFADLAGKASLFVVVIVAARRLTPESFGVFSLGSTLGWLIAVVSDCGIQLHLARAVARRPADASRLLRGWLRVRVWTAAAAAAAVAIGVAAGWRTAGAAPIAILALAYACSGLVELLHYFYRGLSRSDVESSLTLWQRGGTLACGLAALVWKPDVTVLAVAMLIPVVVTLGFSLRIAARLGADTRVRPYDWETQVPAYDRETRVRACDRETQVRAYDRETRVRAYDREMRVRACDETERIDASRTVGADPCVGPSFALFRRDVWPIGLGIVLSALYFRIDVFLVQWWSGTEAVAFYNAVFRLVEALRLFPAAVLAVILPSLVRAGDLRPMARAALRVAAFAVAASAVLWVGAGWLIPLVYGDRYAAAVPAFRVLLLSFPFLSLNLALTHQLIAWDGQRVYAALCAAALVVNVSLNARLIPLWSIEGAAWATLGTELVLTAGCVLALWILRAPIQAGRLVTES
jgi:O-antigen/teichoic acid export membrane protein